MTILQSGVIPSTGGYQIERSLRFNSADTAYLSRTPASAGNRKTWTWSGWVKRSALGTDQGLFARSNSAGSIHTGFLFGSNNAFRLFSDASTIDLITSQVFRDVSSWYHIVVVLDTTQATASNRAKIYVNGSQVTAFSTATYPAQNTDLQINTANPHGLGAYYEFSSGWYFNGYLTEVNFIDGQALTPSDFGETDSNTGVWKPKAYTGTYGTNGFYLKFADNSATTSTTLGKDSSGNGNNWTPNNFSVTAGSGNDSMVDSPTSYGTDTGVGGEVRGNYCTLNPISIKQSSTGSASNGNLTYTDGTGNGGGYSSTLGMSSGKWYWEFTVSSVGAGTIQAGISTLASNQQLDTTSRVYRSSDGKIYDGTTLSSYGNTYTTGDVIGCALDITNGKVYWSKNGTWQNSGDPVTGTNPAYSSGISGNTWYIYVYCGGSATLNYNFGQRAFAYTAPSGFKALCTQNLPTPTIGATSTTQANDYFNVLTYTGNGTDGRTVTGVGFNPDLVWVKCRSNAGAHVWADAVRGSDKNLYSNLTDAETNPITGASGGGIGTVTTDGFVLEQGTVNMDLVNTNTRTYVAWNWKANGAGSTNSNGTAKSSSVTVDSGTDTVTWNSHGMSDGQKIGFFATTMPGGLSAGTLYYVRDAATNTFKVAASSGGAAIDITSNGTTVTAHTTLTSTVSANATSGFSIVTYTGSGSNATVEHGLGVAPSFIITKHRNAADGWYCYHASLGNNAYIQLSSTAARVTPASTYWQTTTPSSTVFSIGTSNSVNQNTINFVAYCFAPVAGYSAFGSYTGNGAADGVFVYTGFRPRYVLIKNASIGAGGYDWCIYDTARNTFNAVNNFLAADLSNAELAGAAIDIDITANGFKLRTTNAAVNGSGSTMIYAAFAETPFRYSLAR